MATHVDSSFLNGDLTGYVEELKVKSSNRVLIQEQYNSLLALVKKSDMSWLKNKDKKRCWKTFESYYKLGNFFKIIKMKVKIFTWIIKISKPSFYISYEKNVIREQLNKYTQDKGKDQILFHKQMYYKEYKVQSKPYPYFSKTT